MSAELEDEIRRKIRGMARDVVAKGSMSRLCTVIAVDEDNELFDAQPLDGGSPIYDVRLNAVKGGDGYGLTLMPEVNSEVIVGVVNGNKNDAFLMMGTDFLWLRFTWDDNTYITIEKDGSINLKAAKTQFNSGSNGGLINIVSLIGKINALESKLTGLADFVAALPVPVSGAVSGPPVPGSTDAFIIQTPTQRADIEDTTIIH